MVMQFCEALLLKIRERQKVCSDTLLSGAFQKLEEYKYTSGRFYSLVESEEIVKEVYKDFFETKDLGNNKLKGDIIDEYE